VDLEIALDPGRVDALVALAHLVAEWGTRINLTGHRDTAEIADRLIVDALALHAQVVAALGVRSARVVDLGSGAGFPGLPIAIADPDCQVELVEARERRHFFQRAVCRRLGVANAHPRLGRIEVLDPTPAPLVFAQAVGPIEAVVGLAARWVEADGWLIVPSGPTLPDLDPGSGWVQHGAVPYRAPGNDRALSFWFARRAD